MPRIQRTEFSRMWLLEGRASPANAPSYQSQWKAGAVTWALGDITNIFNPDPAQYGEFDIVGKIIGEQGAPTLPITARYQADARSILLRIAALGCDTDLQIHMGQCQDPRDFNAGWDKILALDAARLTQWGTTEVGALQPSERATVEEEVTFSGEEIYEIMPIAIAAQAGAEITQEIIGVVICDAAQCAACGLPSDGCQVVYAVTVSMGGSPGSPAEVLFTKDGGSTWGDTNVATLTPAQNPSGLACVGQYLVVISESSESLHYAALADIQLGTETWSEVTSGFVATKGPLAIWSVDSQHTWIAAEGGYIYFSDDAASGVEVQESGSATVEDLQDIHAFDDLHALAVGDNNAVVTTSNGGEAWSTVIGPAVGVDLTCCWMKDANTWVVGTDDGTLFYTVNAGLEWSGKAFPGSGAGSVRDISFANGSVGYMVHDTATPVGRVLRTLDGGFSWYVAPEGNLTTPDNDRLNAVAACPFDANVLFAGGLGANSLDGILLKGA